MKCPSLEVTTQDFSQAWQDLAPLSPCLVQGTSMRMAILSHLWSPSPSSVGHTCLGQVDGVFGCL